MADTNQTNNKGLLESEFKNILKLYTETILKEDSTLPPQNKAVYEAIKNLQDILDQQGKTLASEISKNNEALSAAKTLLLNRTDNNFSDLNTAITSEVKRAKEVEANISDRIDTEKERLDVFLKGEDIEGTAIDTLKEIQRWINDDEVGTAELVIRVGNTETNLEDEIANRKQAIEEVDTNYKTADTEINTKLTGVADRVELLEREIVLISCGNSKF